MSHQEQVHDAAFDDACRFIIKLGEAAHGYGSNAGRLEVYLSRLIAALGFQGVFRSTPTEIVFAFRENENQAQRMHLSAMPETSLDLAKLARVGELVDAVTASSAVPVLFTPITVKSYAGTCGFELPAWVDEAAKDERGSTRKAEARSLKEFMDRDKRPYLHLVDGGIADNLGLRAFYTTFSLEGDPRQAFRDLGHPDVRHVLIISVNSFAHAQVKWPFKRVAPGLAETIGSISSDQIGRYNYDTIDIVRYSFEYWTKQASTPQRPVTFDFVEVSFNQVHDENQRQALNNIGTNFELDDDEVDLLIKAAGEVLRGSPDFRTFLERTNGMVKQP